MSDRQDPGTPRARRQGHRWFAAWYDRLNRSMERRLLARLRARLVGPLRGQVVEIGAGTGANFPFYAEGVEVVATEPDPFMLRRAREKATSSAAHIDPRPGPAERLPFPDGTFDHAVSTLVLCTVSDPVQSLAEIRRVLKPDGRLHFIEHVRADGRVGRVQDVIRPVWRWIGAGCTVNRRTGELIAAAGFTIEQLEREKLPLGIPLLVGTARPT